VQNPLKQKQQYTQYTQPTKLDNSSNDEDQPRIYDHEPTSSSEEKPLDSKNLKILILRERL